ncbi:MAG: hypothetical protein D6731_00385, partial [Planctomycetota bacterium]
APTLLEDGLTAAVRTPPPGPAAASAETIHEGPPASVSSRGDERTAADVEGVDHSLGTRRHRRPASLRARMPERIGNYAPYAELGRGGMGVVYAARHVRTERKAAVKVLLNRGEGVGESAIARFHIEARAAGRLKHPNIVSVLDQDLDPESDQWFLAMELIEGRSLYQRVREEGPLDPRQAAELLLQLADAVAHAHAHDVLHRDLKPHNVLLDANEGDKPLLTDFGLAKLVGDETNLTGAGPTMMGTPGFMPPEQAGADYPVDERADVYGLGATLYFALTGHAPFEGGSVPIVLSRVVHKSPRRPSALVPGVPRDLETICLKCLEKDPAHRYPSASYLQADLERFLASQKIEAVRPPAIVQLSRWASRNRLQAASLASALLLAAGGLVVSAVILTQQARERRALLARERELRERRREVSALTSTVEQRAREVEQRQRALEAVPPTLEIRSPREAELTTREPWVNVVVWIPDDDLARVTLNGRLMTESIEPKTYTARWLLEKEGIQRALIQAVDERGNTTERELVARRDTTPPSFSCSLEPIRYELPDDPGTPVAARVRIELDVAEVASPTVTVHRLTENGGEDLAVRPVGGGWEAELPLRLGENRVRVRVTDAVGNAASEEQVLVRHEPKLLQGAWWPVHPAQRAFAIELGVPVWVENAVGMKFVLVPPGRFRMGSPPGEPGREDVTSVGRETLHEVELSSGFYLGSTEVTRGQFRRVLSGRLDAPPQPGDDEPVVDVTWEAAVDFCRRLGEAEGRPRRYRLPTEAEWEYACRAGTTTPWFWGDDPRTAAEFANVADLDARSQLGIADASHCFPFASDGHVLVAPVGIHRPNPFGLYDTVGNVAEWCFDLLKYDLGPAPARDPDGPERNPNGWRIFRGGSYRDRPAWTRAASRRASGRALRTLGFRVLRIVD